MNPLKTCAVLLFGLLACNQIAGIKKPDDSSSTSGTGNGDDTTATDDTAGDDTTTTTGKDAGSAIGSSCTLGSGCDESTTCQAASVDTREGSCSPVGPNQQDESCTLQNLATLDTSKLCDFGDTCLNSVCFRYCTENFEISSSESVIGCPQDYLCAPAANQWGLCLKVCTGDDTLCPSGTKCLQEPGGGAIYWCVPPSLVSTP